MSRRPRKAGIDFPSAKQMKELEWWLSLTPAQQKRATRLYIKINVGKFKRES